MRPSRPTLTLAHSASRKMASPAKAFIGPIRAWPSRTRTQVSISASSSQFDFWGSAIRSKHEIGARGEQGPAIAEALWNRLPFGGARIGDRHRPVDVNLALPAIVEHAKRRIASLLDFGDRQARADRVNRAGGDVDDIVLQNAAPQNQIRDRAVLDRASAIAGRSAAASVRARPWRPKAAERIYQASVLPCARPIECAKESSG